VVLASLGALVFGASFVGIVSLVLSMAGRYYPTRPAKMMGRMTIAYGTAQILGPAITASLAVHFGGYSIGLYVAAASMGVATLLLFWLRQIERSAFGLAA
jgi:cyanate permease